MAQEYSIVLAAYMPESARKTLPKAWSEFAQPVSDIVEDHHGRVIDVDGPGWFVAAFDSAREGTLCAVEIQRTLHNASDELAGAPIRWLHIGLNTETPPRSCEPWPPARDDSVDRLVSLAEPGGVCLSRTVYDEVRFHVDLPFDASRDPHHTAYACQEIRGKLASLNLLESGAVHLHAASLGGRDSGSGYNSEKKGAASGIVEKLRALLSQGS
jgi:hypothetical protein